MSKSRFTRVEQSFIPETLKEDPFSHIAYIAVENFPTLGLLTALRFLEWVISNPDGVVSLPTGKTPEYFIYWSTYLLNNWDTAEGKDIRAKHGLEGQKRPDLSRLRFVQIDEFYPINTLQHNSFYYYVKHYYIDGLGLDAHRALLINPDTIPLAEGRHYSEIFPDAKVDLSLRYREPKTKLEQLQQKSIFCIDNWCSGYETRIREMGGIGFFLGGIGPDGHIAFNTRGSDHYSTTRLTETNFETQAVAASDLGGIEISRHRLVITLGLGTLCHNPDITAIVFAAGAAKAAVVRDAIEKEPSIEYPATALHALPNARFYLTEGSASGLTSRIQQYYDSGDWNEEKTCRAVIELCVKLDKYAHHLELSDLKSDPFCQKIPGLGLHTVQEVIDSFIRKIDRGMQTEQNQIYFHTGPHHDDIMLGMLPHIHRLLRNETNKASFTILTSGFTAVTNRFIIGALEDTVHFLDSGLIQMTEYPDFFDKGFRYKRDKDIYHYLIKVASGEPIELKRGLSHRIVRAIVELCKVGNSEALREQILSLLHTLRNSYDGEKNPPLIQELKGRIREFEEELVWAYFGIPTKDVYHMRLGFYTGDIFTEQPTRKRDVEPILAQIREINPTVISLAFDPEGSGPDTHYKVLQVLAEALRIRQEETDLSKLRIWGYRNVWYRFHPAEADVIVPVSLNAMAVLDQAFSRSYLTQVEASFPSYEYDGKFSDLTKKIWVDQLRILQLLLGKNFFYEHESPRIRAAHGLLFFREMPVDEFLGHARKLEESMEGRGVQGYRFSKKDEGTKNKR